MHQDFNNIKMKNLQISNENFTLITEPSKSNPLIISISFDLEFLYTLDVTGAIRCYSSYDLFHRTINCLKLQGVSSDDFSWFLIEYVPDLNDLVCTSNSGCIETVKCGLFTTTKGQANGDDLLEQVGVVEGGIAAASWSPDRLILAIITNNDTLLCMPTDWDDVLEVGIEARQLANDVASVSWCDDGSSLAILSVDACDGIPRIRVYSKALQLLAVGRTVNAPGILRSIGPVASFSTNGSMLVTAQRKCSEKLMVVILEKNGLFHGDFELQVRYECMNFCTSESVLVQLPREGGKAEWSVTALHWDVSSTVLAVSLSSSSASNHASSSSMEPNRHMVQLYTRSNYHWYLKLEWRDRGVRCLGFDQVRTERLYLSHFVGGTPAVRTIDLTWGIYRSNGPDCSVSVVDGGKLLLTPLGRGVVPPPMSRHQVIVAGTTICGAFFQTKLPYCRPLSTEPASETPLSSPAEQGSARVDQTALGWGFSCLSGTIVSVVMGDDTGAEPHTASLDLSHVPECASAYFRTLSATSCDVADGDPMTSIKILLGGTRINTRLDNADSDSVDVPVIEEIVVVISVQWSDGQMELISATAIAVQGRIMCSASVPGRGRSTSTTPPFALGVLYNETFEVWAVDQTESVLSLRKLVMMPEPCTQIELVLRSSDKCVSVIGFCAKGRLYCNDSLIVSGINSFALNSNDDKETGMDSLLCVTGGTKPLLRFFSLSAVTGADSLGELDSEPIWEQGEARPVERGARLVAAVVGDAKVVIQLPRGNLEVFEPRPLLLRRARQMLDAGRTLDCLVLLRRQRIDLNLLVDHAPAKFLATVPALVTAALALDSELLSLFISSLSPDDVTVTKYRPPACDKHAELTGKYDKLVFGGGVVDDYGRCKVNGVCSALRAVLLDCLQAGTDAVLQPLLCTYAKSVPPLLVPALALIKSLAGTGTTTGASQSSGSGGDALLSTPKVQSAIKYLSFLADSSQLFDAALGDCDFGLARVIARQAQMDPKQYLPLIASFERIGSSSPSIIAENGLSEVIASAESIRLDKILDKVMRHRVALHLKRFEDAIRWGVTALEGLSFDFSESVRELVHSQLKDMSNTVLESATSMGLQKYAILLCRKALTGNEVSGHTNNAAVEPSFEDTVAQNPMLTTLHSRLLKSHGSLCERRGGYREAVMTYLMTHPPSVQEAVTAARMSGDWLWAISIAARYEDPTAGPEASCNGPTARGLAQEIVDTYMTGLQQGQLAQEAYAAVGLGGVDTSGGEDRSLEVSQLCLDYCDDVEQAVSVLRLTRHWRDAVRMACRYDRRDLMDEILKECVVSAQETITCISTMTREYEEITLELTSLWQNPDVRLVQVASTETALAKLLSVRAVDDAHSDDGRDGRSEYSAATGSASVFSRQSASTARSDRSARSSSSLASTGSVLSTATSASTSSGTTTGDGSGFSVVGMDHAVLSRGQARTDRLAVDQKRRRRKARNLGDSRDVWGLKREGRQAAKLWMFADIGAVAKTVASLCSALLLVGDSKGTQLVMCLQAGVDRFVAVLGRLPAPEAPPYPVDWLRSRDMLDVTRFQRVSSEEGGGGTTPGDVGRCNGSTETWWDRVQEGVRVWAETRLVCFASPESEFV